jgi:branched-chain amino acid transport system ATP-binding protein
VTAAAASTPEPSATGVTLGLEDITVRFGGITALAGVTFDVPAGQICGLIGPNGAGKTTLFDVVSGLRQAGKGRVLMEGRDISRLGATDRSRLGLRRTFQRAQTFGWLTVEDNVLTAMEWRGGGGGLAADLVFSPTRRRRERERRVLAREALNRCGLAAVRNECAGALPIGISRMVEFARATVEPPRLLLLDEPASGLSEHEAEMLGRGIQAVCADSGCAVLLVEHNAGFVMEHCDRVVVLALGSVLADGSPEAVQNDPAVRAAYLGGEA